MEALIASRLPGKPGANRRNERSTTKTHERSCRVTFSVKNAEIRFVRADSDKRWHKVPRPARNKQFRRSDRIQALGSDEAGRRAHEAAKELTRAIKGWRVLRDPRPAMNAGKTTGPTSWLVDSGAAVDLVRSRDIPAEMSPMYGMAERPISLSTANGLIESKETVALQIPSIGETIDAYVVEDTPPVLSLGRMCMKMGYSFRWDKGVNPILITPSGKEIELSLSHHCPYLENGRPDSLPAVAARISTAAPVRGAGSSTDTEADEWEEGADGSWTRMHRNMRNNLFLPHEAKGGPKSSDIKDERTTMVEYKDGTSEIIDDSWRDPGADRMLPMRWSGFTIFKKKSIHDGHRENPTRETGGDQRRASRPGSGPRVPCHEDGVPNHLTARHLATHEPKDPKCPACMECKLQKSRYVRNQTPGYVKYREFGELITCDHIVNGPEDSLGLRGEKNALVMLDRATNWIDVAPAATRSERDARESIINFVGTTKAKVLYSDGANEFAAAARTLGIAQVTSVPGEPSTNGVAERAVKRMLGGIRTLLHQSGLPERWWPFAGRHFSVGFNSTHFGSDSKTPWERRHGVQFGGTLIPFGCVVKFRPSQVEDAEKPGKFAPRAIPGLMMGYKIHPGGDWRGEYFVLPLMDAQNGGLFTAQSTQVHRTKEVIFDASKIFFPAKASYDKRRESIDAVDETGTREHDVEELAEAETSGDSGHDAADGPIATEEAIPHESVEGAISEGDDPPPGYYYTSDGRLTRRQKTSRPDDVWPEEWRGMSVGKRKRVAAEAAPAAQNLATETNAIYSVPAMPTIPAGVNPHRPKCPDRPIPCEACVARPVGKKEIGSNSKAKAALLKEWDKLRKIHCWDESQVREWADVAREARTSGKTIHVGRIFEICVEKGSELAPDDVNRKFKGRVVFQGNNVHDQNWEAAIFNELGSSPAAMEAGKAVDAYGLMPNNDVEQADAEQAYTQAVLKGTPTWVRIPRERAPPEWRKYKDPVCPLRLALYGHPDSGTYWEQHCEKHLFSQGFERIENWRSCFWHPKLKLFLVVYVDDFKMAGPKSNLAEGWALIRSKIKTEDPAPAGQYLGCQHVSETRKVDEGTSPITGFKTGLVTGKQRRVRVMRYVMHGFNRACVERYKELAAGNVRKPRTNHTPFVEEAGVPLNDDVNGVLSPHASQILMKVLYGARMGRMDLLRATNRLARMVTKWSKECDRRLHKLMAYLEYSADWEMVGYVGDPPEDLNVDLFADADFAGCADSQRSTSGVFLALIGPNSFFPLGALSKRQGCVSTSTPEAEVVAAQYAVQKMGIPSLSLWELLLGRPLKLNFREDNEACIKLLHKGYSPALRHLTRTHRVNIAWLGETLSRGHFTMAYVPSRHQAADIFTKHFTAQDKWALATRNIGIMPIKGWREPPPFPVDSKNKRNDDIVAPLAAAAAHLQVGRTIVEYCCSSTSILGRPSRHTLGCAQVRLTAAQDMTTASGIAMAHKALLRVFPLLWAAIPCTGGSTWQHINKHLPGGGIRLRRHWRLFRKLWHNFEPLAEMTLSKGGHVAIEWPRGCQYWKVPRVARFLQRNKLMISDFDGCMVGVTDLKGVPIKKPWRIATSSPRIWGALQGLKCNKHEFHAQCRGAACKATEDYSLQLAARIHNAFAKEAWDASNRMHVHASLIDREKHEE